ncbi:diphthine--ammonia ligase [Methanoculleus sp. FWC-SCC1]|uniref:Diphthine--ammonia ligase n=1 Tax=Methanoculleus frigidifontis TaxID=2584085 RepID=A0ABT8M8U4_9EURY|nr:diphthine--ammonia ligase [Methanoculleus sp. FWC-SCC1]MDN7024340.1 diphthine--ammonia ligase [Methanoculleus sp. FWC-SCC1]
MKLGVLLSGGKDSLFACYRAMEKEEVVCLITVVSRNDESYMFHTPNIHLAALQAEAAGLPLVEVETAGEEERELDDLQRAIALARDEHGIEGVVTGAILSVYQATRVQRICAGLGLWCFNPLWHTDQAAYMEALLAAGFRVLIAGVFAEPFDETWLGREIDADTLAELRRLADRYRISLTGEGGELETFVTDAPFFTQRIVVDEASVTYRNHNGRYTIRQARLVAK